MVDPLATRTAQDLMMEPAVEETMLIDGIMGSGLGFLVATSKAGKSWLAMDISVCVASGRPLWGHETQKGCVLHISLEDTSYERLKKRLWLITDEVEGTSTSPQRPRGSEPACSTRSPCSMSSIRTSSWLS